VNAYALRQARGIGDPAARWVGDQITLGDLRRSAACARDPPIWR